MSTAREIITRSMKKGGILTKNEQPSSDEADDALTTLNDKLALLSNQALMNYVEVLENFPITGGTGTYTIGSGATFNTTRPIVIVDAFVRTGTTDYRLEQISERNYDKYLQTKSTQSIPGVFTYDGNYPTATIKLYPVPATAYTLFLRSHKPLGSLTLDSQVTLPPGWDHYLTHDLAVTLAPEYGVSCPPEIIQIAGEAKQSIEISIAKNRSMDAPPIWNKPFDIFSGPVRQ